MKKSIHNEEGGINIQLGDLLNMEGLKKIEGADVIGTWDAAEIAPVGEKLSEIADAIVDNKDIKIAQMVDLIRSLSLEKLTVNYYGDDMSMEEYMALPNKAENKLIFERFANGEFSSLDVGTVSYLPVKVAKDLARYPKYLYMGIEKIKLRAAEVLAEHKGGLNLHCVTEINKEVAAALGRYSGELNLNGLVEIDEEIVTELAKNPAALYLQGLRIIDPKVAEKLAEHKGTLWLGPYLSKYEMDYNSIAKGLGKHHGELHLHGIWNISLEAARELGKHHGDLHFYKVENLDEEKVKELVKNEGCLEFDGLPQSVLTKEIARALADCKGKLTITGETVDFDIEVLKELCKCKYDLGLPIFNKITKEMAAILAEHVGELSLAVREDMTDEAMEILLNHQGIISGNDKFLMLRLRYLRKKNAT